MQWFEVVLYFCILTNFDGTNGWGRNGREASRPKECPFRPPQKSPLSDGNTETCQSDPESGEKFISKSGRNTRKSPEEICNPELKECNPNVHYYSMDGTCNNLRFSYYGRVELPFNRMLPANYSDGVCAIRRSSDGSPLPLSRVIRTTLLENREIFSNKLNILFYSFGQWLTHDVAFQNPSSSTVSCCKNNQPVPNMPLDVCLPTIIPRDDPFYSQFGVTCLEQKRSINTETFGCKTSPCAPINFATAWLDLSILYSSYDETADNIRLHQGGLLKTEDYGTNELFPTLQSGSACPRGGIEAQANGTCFLIGDLRINQNPELTVMAVLFTRMHNNIARRLQSINPHWEDDRLFHVARKILIAMYQTISLREHISIIIGPEMMSWYKLYPLSAGYAEGYDPTIDPQTIGEYEAAAGRVLHSLIRGSVPYEGSDGEERSYLLRNKFFNQEFLLQRNIFFNIVESYGLNRSDKQDKYFSEEATNHMLSRPEEDFGFDLPAVDLDRARDHGLATYNDVRQACGLRRFRSFDDMAGEIRDPQDVEKLRHLYKSVEDIDLYIAILEKPLPNALLGPTLACVTGEAFWRFKHSDRLFAEFQGAMFTTAQLDSIRETTFAQILCTANQGQEYVYKYSFLIPSPQNPRLHCSEIPSINLELWRDRQ